MKNLDEIEVNVLKIKKLLEHIINNDFAFDEANKNYDSIHAKVYRLTEIYNDTSLFLDVIFDYIYEIEKDIMQVNDRGIEQCL